MSGRAAGHGLIGQLDALGCRRVFTVPGESFLPILDGLHDHPRIETVVCRQEGGAAMMAEAHGKLTGQPGVCLVSRGPGATNASAGLHVAQQDSTPLLLIVGQVSRAFLGREAFQEMDLVQFLTPVAKRVEQVSEAARLNEAVARAWACATAGRPGPVALVVPEDLLGEAVAGEVIESVTIAAATTTAAQIDTVMGRLRAAERPLVLVGGPGWSQRCNDRLAEVAERLALPVAAAFRCQDYFDNTHPCYVGDVGLGINPALAARVREADLILAIGARLGEATTSGYELLAAPRPVQSLVHVHPDAAELGRVYRPDLGIAAASAAFIEALADAAAAAPAADRRARIETARADYEAWTVPQPTPGTCRLERVVAHLREALPAEAIITNGAGNYAGWVHRYHRFRRYGTQLAPRCGSMGYGLPAAVAAALERPDHPVVCFAGDGCLLMHGQELATAVRHRARLVVIVANNGYYGTIRMHQAQRFPGREVATALTNPDFTALARAYGAQGVCLADDAGFPAALAAALAAEGPALIELMTDPQAISTHLTLGDLEDVG